MDGIVVKVDWKRCRICIRRLRADASQTRSTPERYENDIFLFEQLCPILGRDVEVARRQRLHRGVAPYKTVRAVVSRPTGLAAADEVGAGTVAGAAIEADLALLKCFRCVYDEERCDASHGCFPQTGALGAAGVVCARRKGSSPEADTLSNHSRARSTRLPLNTAQNKSLALAC